MLAIFPGSRRKRCISYPLFNDKLLHCCNDAAFQMICALQIFPPCYLKLQCKAISASVNNRSAVSLTTRYTLQQGTHM
jgi:hypothetical protein